MSVHTSSPPHLPQYTPRTSGVSVTVQSAILRIGLSSWSIACLKEYLRKKEDTVVCCSRKPSFLNAKYLSIVISHTHCVARTPRCFSKRNLKQQQQQQQQQKKKPPGTNFACIATSSPCFLPASDSECLSTWPRRRRGQTHRFPFVYVLRTLTWVPSGRKKNHRWHRTCFWEVSSLTRPQRTGDGRVHIKHGHESEIFSQGGRAQCIRRAVWDTEVRPVRLTNGK